LLPGRPGHVGRNSDKGNRLFVEAVIWKLRTGAPWRDLPERFGDWKNTLAAASASMGSDLPLRLRWRRLGLSTSITEIPAAFRWRASPAP